MRLDPHSFADLEQGTTRHLHLDWTIDMDQREIRGVATLTLEQAGSGPLDLDTRDLHIESVEDDEGELDWNLEETDPVIGCRLQIQRTRPTDTVRIRYRTGNASGLMWLEPAQTAGEHPFLLSQCQAIHARSLVPLQDTPRARITYTATLSLPDGLSAVMSAAPPVQDDDGRWSFSMPQPIAPYLLAIAVGELESRDLGPRTRVWAEPAVIEQAAWEFADAEQMLEAAEGLFGPYPWERYDFIVLPASFPMGGMENPRMTFLTPTLLAGDRSLVSVLAHELAHSWTGNLVTNADNEHFWLNEGWTVYAERRILELLYGPEKAIQSAVLNRIRLEETFRERHARGQRTALTYPQQGLHPDTEFSLVPYEKGFTFLTALERAVGRERFDRFVQGYIERFRFQAIDTATFVDFVDEQLGRPFDFEPWLHEDGLPDTAPTFHSDRLETLATLAAGWHDGDRPDADLGVYEQLYYVSKLPKLEPADLDALDALLGLRTTGNAELKSAWLTRVASSGDTREDDAIRDFVGTIGRAKLLKPLFTALIAADRRDFARSLLAVNQERLHTSARGALERTLD